MKKGFTLIELLAIIVLLGLVFAISYPKIIEIIEKKDTEIDEVTINILYNSAQQYIDNDTVTYPNTIGESYNIRINDMILNNLVPIDATKYKNKCVRVTIGTKNSYRILEC